MLLNRLIGWKSSIKRSNRLCDYLDSLGNRLLNNPIEITTSFGHE